MAKVTHNWAELFERGVKNAPNCGGWTDLARLLGISRKTLSQGLDREYDIASYTDLLAQSDRESNLRVWQARATYWERTAERLEQRLTNRQWLVEELAALVPVMHPVEIPKLADAGEGADQVAVLVFSDAHFGLSIPEGQLGYFGTYNSALAEARTIHTFRNFSRLAHMQTFPVRKAKVYLLGDNIEHSHMRVIQAKQTDAHVVKQTEHASRVMAHCLRFLCGEFEEVEVEAVPGNHGRATAKHGENLPDETFDHLIYYIIEHALADQSNFKINNHTAWYFVDNILGYKASEWSE